MEMKEILNSSKFYELNEIERNKILKDIKLDIKRNGSPILNEMVEIAENEVMVHIEDFYIHDLKHMELAPTSTYIWFVRTKGTFLINLLEDSFNNNDEWVPLNFAKSIMNQMKIEKYYIIEKGEKIKKVNEKSCCALLSIYADMAYKNKQLKVGAW